MRSRRRNSTQTTERPALVRAALSIGVASGTYGLSFGAIAVTSGFSVAQACALSLLMFTGASQFALVGVVAAGGSPVSGAATALLLGARNALYGLRLASLLRLRGVRRVAAAQLLIDESTALALRARDPRNARLGFFAAGFAVFVLWNVATLLGALSGAALGDPRTLGFDAAVPAAFLALLWPRVNSRRHGFAALAGALVALGLVTFLTPGLPILAAAAVAIAVALLPEPVSTSALGRDA